MSEHTHTEHASTQLRVSAADVDWIDRHGTARVHGYFFTPYDIVTAEFPGDRTETGELRILARQRIAAELTRDLSTRIAATARGECDRPADAIVADPRAHDRRGVPRL